MKKTIAIALSLCLLITSIFITPLASAESTYSSFSWDFLNSVPQTSSTGENISEAGSFSADIDSTSGVLKLKAVNPDDGACNVVYRITKLTGLKANTKYHISFNYSIEGNSGSIVKLAAAVATQTGATQSVQTPEDALGITPVSVPNSTDLPVNTSLTFSGEMTSHSTTTPTLFYIGYRVAAGETVTLNVDEITVSEVIDDNGGVTASASNTDMGTASVINTNTAYSDFAVGETALFTAKANDGYEFVNWTDAAGNIVSTKTSHKIASLKADTALTANFAAANYMLVVYDYESTTLDSEVFDTTNRYTWRHFGSFNTTDPIEGSTSYQIKADPDYISEAGVRRGYLAEDATYKLKAGNAYHLSLSAKALERSESNIPIVLATITGKPTSNIRYNNLLLLANDKNCEFYASSDNKFDVHRTVTPQSDGYLAYYTTSIVDFTILFDNIIISEVLDDAEGNPLVSATTADTTMGTASVTNADDNFTTFARGETAVYTATPNDDYAFDYWMDEDGNVVSTQPTYSVVLDANGDNAKALTAHFKATLETDLNEGTTDATIKVLCIGDSYTVNATELLAEMAAADDIDLRIGRAVINDSSLQTHYNNSQTNEAAYSFDYTKQAATTFTAISDLSLDKALSMTDWDYITLQQSAVQSADDYDTHYAPYASLLMDYVKERQPNAEILIHQTWAYSADQAPAKTADIQEGGLSQAEMFARLQANYKQLAEELGNLRIIPTGTAWQIIRDGKTLDAESDYGSDILHSDEAGNANYLGKLLAAYSYYEAVTDISPTNSSYEPKATGSASFTTTDAENTTTTTTFDLTADMISALQTAVEQALALYTDVGMVETSPTAQMRQTTAAKDQALRFKFTIDTDLLAKDSETGIAGYTLVEYGSLVTLDTYRTDAYNGTDWLPVWFENSGASVVTQGKGKVTIGRSYVKGEKDTIFEVNGNKTVYTAALTRIGYSPANPDTIDYSKWEYNYYVLPYAVYENEAGIRVVKYARDSAFTYSMFDMIATIVNSTSDDDQTKSDKAYINDTLFENNEALVTAWINYGGTVDADGNPEATTN